MELPVINAEGRQGSPLQVSDATFGAKFNEALIHQVVVAHQAGARAGTRAQKNRAAVRGGGRKPYRQKGTGRARAGTIRQPDLARRRQGLPSEHQGFFSESQPQDVSRGRTFHPVRVGQTGSVNNL